MDFSNNNIYHFLKEEISFHSELKELLNCDLESQKDNAEFWEDLNEHLDCFTICDICSKPMIEGYVMNGTHYCSEDCLLTDYTNEEVNALCNNNNSDCYYTNWYEDSIIYNQK